MTSRNRLSRTKLNAARPCVAGVSLVALLCLLGPLAVPAHARIIFPAPRFPFTIDPRTPLQELLPVPPDTVEPIAPWLVKDWSQVPAVFFQKPAAVKRAAPSRPRTPEEEQRLAFQPDSLKSREEAMKQTALTIAKINHLNQKGADHFLKTLVDTRHNLVGLPFVMGDACRQSKERGGAFAVEVNAVRTTLERGGEQKPRPGDRGGDDGKFWENYDKFPSSLEQKRKETEAEARERTPAQIAALVQILGPEQAVLRQGLVKHLSGIDHPEATRTLARLAVFSFEEEVRRRPEGPPLPAEAGCNRNPPGRPALSLAGHRGKRQCRADRSGPQGPRSSAGRLAGRTGPAGSDCEGSQQEKDPGRPRAGPAQSPS